MQDSDFGAVSLYAGFLDITDEAWTTANLSDDGENCGAAVGDPSGYMSVTLGKYGFC